MRNIILYLISAVLLFSCTASEIVIDSQWLPENYTKKEVMIPMRDGIRLYTSVYEPVECNDRPILMIRTPYSCAPYGEGWNGDLTQYLQEYLANRYVIVFQDVRGRYMSEGEFVNVRPFIPEKAPGQIDEASDTYDTIEWLIQNTDNNGAVGVTGMSYPGFYATMAALSGHPALKAVSPQAPILDFFKGDDIHHNGALMLMDIYSFSTYMFKEHDNPVEVDHGLPSPIGGNAYDWFLEMMTPSRLTEALPDTLPFWNEILEHPDYDSFWIERSIEPHLKEIMPAMLVVGGSFDTDDCYGALNTYKLIKKNSPETDLHFVYGPWTHGGWHHADYKGLGQKMTVDGISSYFMKNIEYPFFRHYLEGKGRKPEPVYVYPSESAEWQILDIWPPEGMKMTPLYLTQNDSLSWSAPEAVESFSTYVSDPHAPVPFMKDASHRDNSYMVADQRFASGRSDVLTFTGEELTGILKLQGPVEVDLDLSLSTDDADVIVKLIDVYPDGYQMLIRADVFPVRYRESYSEPMPAVPGEIFGLKYRMNDVAHWFHPGHRIMIQIQSTCFPLMNLNPQTYMENIYEASPSDYVSAEVTVYHQMADASRILLPIVD